MGEWRFDIVALLEHLLRDALGLVNLEPGVDSRRITGDMRDGGHASILVKPVGPANAGTYRGWVTLSPGEFAGISHAPPRGWHGFVAMVGLLDNGQPWWVGVYRRDDLAAVAGIAERVNRDSGGVFYRFGPELIKPVFFADLLEIESPPEPKAPPAPPAPPARAYGVHRLLVSDIEELILSAQRDIPVEEWDHGRGGKRGKSSKQLALLLNAVRTMAEVPTLAEVDPEYARDCIRRAFPLLKDENDETLHVRPEQVTLPF